MLDVRDDGVGFLAERSPAATGIPATATDSAWRGCASGCDGSPAASRSRAQPGDGTAVSASVPAISAEGGR